MRSELCGNSGSWTSICKACHQGAYLTCCNRQEACVSGFERERGEWKTWAQMEVHGRVWARKCHGPVCRTEFPERCWVMEEPYNLTAHIRYLHSWRTCVYTLTGLITGNPTTQRAEPGTLCWCHFPPLLPPLLLTTPSLASLLPTSASRGFQLSSPALKLNSRPITRLLNKRAFLSIISKGHDEPLSYINRHMT